MAPPSPQTAESDLTTLAVLADGSELPGSYQVLSLRVTSAFNRIPVAEVELADGDAAGGTFLLSAGKTLAPGATLQIKLGYHGKNKSVFTGVVTAQAIRKRPGTPPVLRVEASDLAVKLTIGRRSAVYTGKSDKAIIESLLSAAGVTGSSAATKPALKVLTQFIATDWDFIVTRAEANGLLVAAHDGKTEIIKPELSQTAVLSLTYGSDVLDFNLRQDAASQWKKVRATAWDSKEQKMIEASASLSDANAAGSPGSIKLAEVASPAEVLLQSSAALAQDTLTAWAEGAILRSELAKLRGEVRFQGSSLVTPGKAVLLAGFGARFDGTALVSGVIQEVTSGLWTTTAELGFAEERFAELVDLTAPPAAGLLAAVAGLQNGTVKQIDQDPDGNLRVLVQISVVGASADGVWARLGSSYASADAGVFFFPELGDEVILGFIDDDPGNPIILGSVYSGSKKKPPFQPDADNGMKAIVTKGKLHIELNDKDQIITVKTPKGNQAVLSDKDSSITVTDQNGNSIKLSSSGIELKSASKIVLDAKSGVEIKTASGDVQVSASAGKLSGAALNVSMAAQAQLALSGNATASLKASGECEIQGALVKIN